MVGDSGSSRGFSYEHYMNLIFHLDCVSESVPLEIAKRVVAHAVAPVISVFSSRALDAHLRSDFSVDSLYMLLRHFGGCVTDRDQAMEAPVGTADTKVSNLEPPKTSAPNRLRSNSNSLYQRDSTQLQFVRFARALPDLLATRNGDDMVFDHESLELYLHYYLDLVVKHTDDSTPHKLLRSSIYHAFFSMAISSTTNLSPFETFNHPVCTLIALDIANGDSFEEARDLLNEFKGLPHKDINFPVFINTNDITPIFLLCYDADDPLQVEICEDLSKRIKKQLFVTCLSLPLWDSKYKKDKQIELHQPVMSSLDEMICCMKSDQKTRLSLKLINKIYDQIDILIYELLIPFMQRKIAFWEEKVLQPRKSMFHGGRFFKRIIDKTSNAINQQSQQQVLFPKGSKLRQTNSNVFNGASSASTNYYSSSSPEFLLRKLADWSMMISDYKTAYLTYEALIRDLDDSPKYLASCLEWSAVASLMGAQSIVTSKMIKTEIDPLIERALDIYQNCATDLHIGSGEEPTELIRSYETRCMLLTSELFLSLSDTWSSTPYAIKYLETVLGECKLGPCSQNMIWERLSDCYNLRVDPRIKPKIHDSDTSSQKEICNKSTLHNYQKGEVVSQGLTRRRKAAFFRLLAAKNWALQKQWTLVSWGLRDIDTVYSKVGFLERSDLVLNRLRLSLLQYKNKTLTEGFSTLSLDTAKQKA